MARRHGLPESLPGKDSLAWALAVVSSEAQAESLPDQRRWAEATATSNGWKLLRVVEGVASGKVGPRKVVRDLLADLRALDPTARPKVLLMIRADRLGRGSIIDSQIVIRDLQDLGVSLFTRDQGFVRLDSAMAELISSATLAAAAHENDVRSDKMLDVYRKRRDAGTFTGNRPPYGMLRKEGALVRDGKRAAVVREAFKLRLRGNGYDAIGKRLENIAPPQSFRNGKSHEVKWTATRIMRMLTNRNYVVGKLVSEADFARAQRVAETLSTVDRSRDRRRRWPWPLAGALRCYCGRMMIGTAGGQEPWRIRYYACRYGAHDVSVRLVRADSLEEQFVDLLRRLRASPQLVERYRKRANAPVSPKLLERTLRELKAKVEEVNRRRESAWELHVAGRVRSEDVQERLDKLAKERQDLQGRVNDVLQQITVAKAAGARNRDVESLFRRAPAIFAEAAEPDQRAIAHAVALELGGLKVDVKGQLSVGRGGRGPRR
jgi:DNA invertase Pin-like site-specific DNA recombinase